MVVTREMHTSETGGALCSAEAERVTGFGSQTVEEMLAVEESLEIQLGYGAAQSRSVKSISVTMRTPGNAFELAAGFLMTEGVVHDVNEIERIAYAAVGKIDGSADATAVGNALSYRPTNNVVRVDLSANVRVSLSTLERNFYTTSSCGIRGKASLLALRAVCPPRRRNVFSISGETLYVLPSRLREAQAKASRIPAITPSR